MKIWTFIKGFYAELFFSQRFFMAYGLVVLGFILSFFYPFFYAINWAILLLLSVAALSEGLILFLKRGIQADRDCPEKFSNGDFNTVNLSIENKYGIPVHLEVIDELPAEFQKRDFLIKQKLNSGEAVIRNYQVRPTRRGNYTFGSLHILTTSSLGFIKRRLSFSAQMDVPVYPSYLEMRKYEFIAISNRLKEFGIKKIRRIGHNSEFEQIKEYVSGDDFRTINWKASARKSKWMVNQYQEERSQQIIHVIDKGRVMKHPFNGMSLLDYAINTSLMLSNIAIKKQDKAGLITFDHKNLQYLAPNKMGRQMFTIQEALYKQETEFQESNFELLYSQVRRQVQQRSLLLIYTNFDTVSSMERNLKYLRGLAKYHLVVVIFFENTENKAFIQQPSQDLRDTYLKTIGEQFEYEKKLIADELRKHGIMTVLSAPENLSIQTLNKYLELKARGLI